MTGPAMNSSRSPTCMRHRPATTVAVSSSEVNGYVAIAEIPALLLIQGYKSSSECPLLDGKALIVTLSKNFYPIETFMVFVGKCL
jgi:hypothetical protein